MAVFLFYIVNDALHANPMPFPGRTGIPSEKTGGVSVGFFSSINRCPERSKIDR